MDHLGEEYNMLRGALLAHNGEHEHWCDECLDVWIHGQCGPVMYPPSFPCPEHQWGEL